MEESEERKGTGIGRSQAEERIKAAAAATIAPQKSVDGENILFMKDKEIAIAVKKTFAQDTEGQKTYGVSEKEQWSNLPMDLLILVTERLTPADHLRMSTTCKSWQCIAPSFLFSKTPILLFIENHTSNFFDPLSKKICVTCIPELLDVTFHYSKGGWLLLSQNNNQWQFFFFNPISNEKINLPSFCPTTSFKYQPSTPGDFVVSFSSPPTSQDCVVFLTFVMTFHCLRRGSSSYYYPHHTCTRSDNTWEWKSRSDSFDELFFDHFFPCQPACHNNHLYFNGALLYLNTWGTLVVVRLLERATFWQTVHKPSILSSCEHDDCYLVESQGEILSIFFFGNQTRVFQLDRSAAFKGTKVEKWSELKSLGDNMLFLDPLISLSTVVRGKGIMTYFPTSERGCNDLQKPVRRIWIDLNSVLKTN